MRRGFSLFELLVVMGILVVLMGLTVGAIAGRKTDKLVASEQLVASVVRQARHTARTTGQPVVVAIRKAERTISGIARVPVFWEGFDGGGAAGATGNITGWAGFGYQVVLGDPATAPPIVHPLEPRLRVVRDGAGEGFYLGCRVFPGASSQFAIDDIIPLIVLGAGDARDTSVAGLRLQITGREVQRVAAGGFAQPGAAPAVAQRHDDVGMITWSLIGWVVDDNGAVLEVSGTAAGDRPLDVTRDEPVLHASTTDRDIAWPMGGGRWEDVGLLWDGERIVLYRNGARVGEHRPPAGTRLRVGDEAVHIGVMQWTAGPRYATDAVLDDVVIHRLATSDARAFPADVTPDADHRIVCHPDGRVDVDHLARADDAAAAGSANAAAGVLANTPTIALSGPFANAGKAEIEVEVDGTVSSRVLP